MEVEFDCFLLFIPLSFVYIRWYSKSPNDPTIAPYVMVNQLGNLSPDPFSVLSLQLTNIFELLKQISLHVLLSFCFILHITTISVTSFFISNLETSPKPKFFRNNQEYNHNHIITMYMVVFQFIKKKIFILYKLYNLRNM